MGKKENIKGWIRYFGEILKTVLPAILLALFITQVLIINVNVPSASMETTIMTGSRLIGNRLSYIKEDPKRGDIIIFHYPDNENILFVKRIIGLPGETVEIKAADHAVYINDKKLDEPYLKEQMFVDKDMTFNIPSDSYFCMGDNRNGSVDGRYWKNHYVKKEKIVAKVLFQYWKGIKFFGN